MVTRNWCRRDLGSGFAFGDSSREKRIVHPHTHTLLRCAFHPLCVMDWNPNVASFFLIDIVIFHRLFIRLPFFASKYLFHTIPSLPVVDAFSPVDKVNISWVAGMLKIHCCGCLWDRVRGKAQGLVGVFLSSTWNRLQVLKDFSFLGQVLWTINT